VDALQQEVAVKQHELDEYADFCKHLEKANQALLQENEFTGRELETTKASLQQLQENVTYQRQENERKAHMMEENSHSLSALEASLVTCFKNQ